jgi:hypothetical protein
VTENQQPPDGPDEDRIKIEDLAPKTDESAQLTGGPHNFPSDWHK